MDEHDSSVEDLESDFMSESCDDSDDDDEFSDDSNLMVKTENTNIESLGSRLPVSISCSKFSSSSSDNEGKTFFWLVHLKLY